MCSKAQTAYISSAKVPKQTMFNINAPYPPRVQLVKVGPGRDFGFILHQTKIVYDQLLEGKLNRLMRPIHEKKIEFDNKCTELDSQGATTEALQYGVRAQEYLNREQASVQHQIGALQQDYQHKLDTMYTTMEDAWRKKR